MRRIDWKERKKRKGLAGLHHLHIVPSSIPLLFLTSHLFHFSSFPSLFLPGFCTPGFYYLGIPPGFPKAWKEITPIWLGSAPGCPCLCLGLGGMPWPKKLSRVFPFHPAQEINDKSRGSPLPCTLPPTCTPVVISPSHPTTHLTCFSYTPHRIHLPTTRLRRKWRFIWSDGIWGWWLELWLTTLGWWFAVFLQVHWSCLSGPHARHVFAEC